MKQNAQVELPMLDFGDQGQLVPLQPRLPGGVSLLLRSPDGRARVAVHVGDQEVVLEPYGARVRIAGVGALTVDVDELHVNAKTSMSLHSDGALRLSAGERVEIEAATLALEATQGDAAITANDDVRIEGERVRMNA